MRALYVPAAHAVQAAEVAAAATEEKAPAAQLVQLPAPDGTAEYAPGAHAVQAAAPVGTALYVPAPQARQAASLQAPAAEKVTLATRSVPAAEVEPVPPMRTTTAAWQLSAGGSTTVTFEAPEHGLPAPPPPPV